ncbi:hypothetical protein BF49_5195 [Bradyrhizobium sp.]|nr:hypothetical protein BF49_5195 [Bradyrhizobium sp.]
MVSAAGGNLLPQFGKALLEIGVGHAATMAAFSFVTIPFGVLSRR